MDNFFQLSADLNPRLEYFVDYLVNVTEPDMEMMLETPFPLDYFLPNMKKMFYRLTDIKLMRLHLLGLFIQYLVLEEAPRALKTNPMRQSRHLSTMYKGIFKIY